LAKTLPKKVQARLFYVSLTNRLEWEKTLDPRIMSILNKSDLIFEPYGAHKTTGTRTDWQDVFVIY